MKIQQLSIFVENREGRLAQITEVLAAAQIDIRAISVADTSDFGILRLIVNDPGQAVKALKAAGMTVSLTDVIGIGINDRPGEFSIKQFIIWETWICQQPLPGLHQLF